MRKWASQGVKAQTCVTSPPYFGLRDYGHDGQIGLEETPEEYIKAMVEVFRCVWDVLEDDGTLWLNIGDSYAGNNSRASNNGRAGFGNEREKVVNRTGEGLKTKDLIGIPWMLAFALRADGWFLRQDIIWHKPNPMPESVQDRCTKAHEYIFLMSKSQKYYYDHEAIKEPLKGEPETRDKNAEGYQADYSKGDRFSKGERVFGADGMANKRSVWSVPVKPYTGAHFAVFPSELIEPCILAGAPVGGIVLDPFMGSGTTAQVSQDLGRQYIGCELNPAYEKLQKKRTAQTSLGFA
jgi:DNA modification methylase